MDADVIEPVDRLVDQLGERRWDGDQELVDTLEDAAGRRPSSLPLLPVELADVGEALSEQVGSENYPDLRTGMIWSHTMTDFGVDEDRDVDLSDESRWLMLVGERSDEAYRGLQRFIATVDEDLGARLTEAIESRGAFWRFRAVLDTDEGEYTRWHRFDAGARLGRARRWLADQCYRARPVRRHDLA